MFGRFPGLAEHLTEALKVVRAIAWQRGVADAWIGASSQRSSPFGPGPLDEEWIGTYQRAYASTRKSAKSSDISADSISSVSSDGSVSSVASLQNQEAGG